MENFVIMMYICSSGRVADGICLESRRAETLRGFKSLLLRLSENQVFNLVPFPSVGTSVSGHFYFPMSYPPGSLTITLLFLYTTHSRAAYI